MSRSITNAALVYTSSSDITGPLSETRVIESADPEDMETQVAGVIAEFAARTDPAWSITHLDLAGGGDGHAFVCVMEFEATDLALGLDTTKVAAIVFYMASQRDALLTARLDAQARLVPALSQTGIVTEIQTGLAGTSKGTRFMGFVLAENVDPGDQG
jgi:hypothetical protein